MRKIFFVLAFLAVSVDLVSADDTTQNPAYSQARQDYREYLKQLQALNQQYKELTGEIKKVVKEEGLPTWDAGDVGLDAWAWADPQVKDADKEMVVTVEMPGLNKRSIHVSLQDGRNLKITAEKKTKEAVQKIVELPVAGLERGSKAKYEDGILTITVPKAVPANKEVSVPVQ